VHGDIKDVRSIIRGSVVFSSAGTHEYLQKNILVDASGHIRLADFGLAIMGESTVGRMTTTFNGCGSVHWMSPQRLSEKAGRRCRADDVYAFGCLAYMVFHCPERSRDSEY
jgi:serine/threonine protein kinase